MAMKAQPVLIKHPHLNIIWSLLANLPKIQITEEWKRHLLYVPVIEAVIPADPAVIPIKVSI